MEGQPQIQVKYVGQIGRIDPFDENLEDIDTYIQRLNQFFAVNEITDGKKAPALLSLVGPKVFRLLKSVLQPETPESRTYEQLCTALRGHFAPKPNITAERFRFQSRKQQNELKENNNRKQRKAWREKQSQQMLGGLFEVSNELINKESNTDE